LNKATAPPNFVSAAPDTAPAAVPVPPSNNYVSRCKLWSLAKIYSRFLSFAELESPQSNFLHKRSRGV
ncbi:MAG: hypothetical protein K2Y28_13300, partial [Burkholderiaceae bacterium]|nr:hypothetical protein [Burkholderiaceae bacterium]